MPGKYRQGKGKHTRSTKKSKALQRQGRAPIVQAPAPSAVTQAPVASVSPSRAPKVPAAAEKTVVNPYPYVAGELRRIALLSGIIIAILIVLSLTLS
jgi:uncharacterized membrane protein